MSPAPKVGAGTATQKETSQKKSIVFESISLSGSSLGRWIHPSPFPPKKEKEKEKKKKKKVILCIAEKTVCFDTTWKKSYG